MFPRAITFLRILFFVLASLENTKSLFQNRIVNGYTTEIALHPYQASFRLYDDHICGAVIIAPRFLVTAAHCIEQKDPLAYSVTVGNSYAERGLRFQVKAVHPHEKYSNLDFDIAVIKISGEFKWNATIQPILLPRMNERVPPKTLAVVTGWGYAAEDGEVMEHLNKLIVPVLPFAQCKRFYRKFLKFSLRMMCAGFVEGIGDACQGDSGGPLVARGKLIGLVSSGHGCARRGYPGVYTNVAKFVKWIEETVKRL